MKYITGFILTAIITASCSQNKKPVELPLIGTWELVSATSTEKTQLLLRLILPIK